MATLRRLRVIGPRRLAIRTVQHDGRRKYVREIGRGSRVRTRDLRFWRPSLYQLSYTPRAVVLITRTVSGWQDLLPKDIPQCSSDQRHGSTGKYQQDDANKDEERDR